MIPSRSLWERNDYAYHSFETDLNGILGSIGAQGKYCTHPFALHAYIWSAF